MPSYTLQENIMKTASRSPQELVLEMVSSGATKTAIAKVTGVTDMTILRVSKGTTKTIRKLKKL